MTRLYIETSAVLAWLFGEPEASAVVEIINRTGGIVTSSLTLLEVERSLLRAEKTGIIKAAERQKARGVFMSVSSSWTFLSISPAVMTRASSSFPVEPVRSLDAIHLASILELIPLYPDMTVLSFDKRICDNVEPLGLTAAALPS